VHKVTVARRVLREYKGTTGLFPSGHLIALREKAIEKYRKLLEMEVGNL
jgi:acyl-CoA dehydrogenase